MALVTQLNPIQVVGEVPFDAFMQRRQMFEGRAQAAESLEYTLILPNRLPYGHKGRLVAGSGGFNPATQMMAITVEFDNPEFILRPGLEVTLRSALR